MAVRHVRNQHFPVLRKDQFPEVSMVRIYIYIFKSKHVPHQECHGDFAHRTFEAEPGTWRRDSVNKVSPGASARALKYGRVPLAKIRISQKIGVTV